MKNMVVLFSDIPPLVIQIEILQIEILVRAICVCCVCYFVCVIKAFQTQDFALKMCKDLSVSTLTQV